MKKYAVLFEEFISDPAQEASLQRQFQTNNMGPIPVTHEVAEIVSDENGMSVDVKGGDTPIVDMTDPGADAVEEAERHSLSENTNQLKNKYSGLLREKKFGKEDLATLDSTGSYRGTEDAEVKKLGIVDKKELIDHIRNQMNDEWIKKEIH
jgi:hypothetical protein